MADEQRPKPTDIVGPPTKYKLISKGERHQRLRDKWKSEDDERTQMLAMRQRFAKQVFWLVVVWHAAVFAMLWSCACHLERNQTTLPASVLVALTSTTTANVLGSLVIVLRFVFPATPKSEAPPKKKRTRKEADRGTEV